MTAGAGLSMKDMLDQKRALLAPLRETARKRVTLLYSARDAERNQAVVLRDYLLSPGRGE